MASLICPRCAFTSRSFPLLKRYISTSRPTQGGSTPTKTISPNAAQTSNPSRSPPAATSTSAAQPFSTPTTPSPAATGIPTADLKPKKPAVVSATPAGKVLKGLNYHKNRDDPVALPDADYPDWLWSILEPSGDASAAGAGDKEIDPRLFAKSANVRRKANKRARAAEALQGGSEGAMERVPLHKQTVDLPAGEGAVKGRIELTRSMRSQRRRDIKEKNFLKEMS